MEMSRVCVGRWAVGARVDLDLCSRWKREKERRGTEEETEEKKKEKKRKEGMRRRAATNSRASWENAAPRGGRRRPGGLDRIGSFCSSRRDLDAVWRRARRESPVHGKLRSTKDLGMGGKNGTLSWGMLFFSFLFFFEGRVSRE